MFEFKDLAAQSYQLVASAPGFRNRVISKMQVKSNSKPLKIELVVADTSASCHQTTTVDYKPAADRRGAHMTVMVVRERSTPIAGAKVTLVDSNGLVLVDDQTGDNGISNFGSIKPGKYEIRVDAKGYRGSRNMDIWVTREDLTSVRVTLLESGIVVLC